MTQHHSSPSAGPPGGNSKTAIGAIVTVLLAAIGGTAFLFTHTGHPPPTVLESTPDTNKPAATQPATPTDKSNPSEVPPTGKADKSTKPKPPPADPG
jgi:hypothetical protein